MICNFVIIIHVVQLVNCLLIQKRAKENCFCCRNLIYLNIFRCSPSGLEGNKGTLTQTHTNTLTYHVSSHQERKHMNKCTRQKGTKGDKRNETVIYWILLLTKYPISFFPFSHSQSMLRFPIEKQFRFHKLKVTVNFGTHCDPFTKSFARIHNEWLSIRVWLILWPCRMCFWNSRNLYGW